MSASAEEKRVDVLIAGAGGFAASALLAHHGVRTLVIEKRREIFLYPKARNLNFRSLEILRGLGVGQAVNAVAEHISNIVGKQTLNSVEEEAVLDPAPFFPSTEGLSPEPFGRYCPQSKLEPILLAETRQRGSEVLYGDDAGVVHPRRHLRHRDDKGRRHR